MQLSSVGHKSCQVTLSLRTLIYFKLIVLHLWGMSFILKRVHFISIHFSVFVYMIPKQNNYFFSVQVIIEWVNSYFQSQWNSPFCTKSCKPKTLFRIENGNCVVWGQLIFQCKCNTNFTLEEKWVLKVLLGMLYCFHGNCYYTFIYILISFLLWLVYITCTLVAQ